MKARYYYTGGARFAYDPEKRIFLDFIRSRLLPFHFHSTRGPNSPSPPPSSRLDSPLYPRPSPLRILFDPRRPDPTHQTGKHPTKNISRQIPRLSSSFRHDLTSRKENIYVCISKEERDSLQKCGEDSFLSTVREMIINSRTLHPFVPWLIAKIISGGCAFFDLYLYLSLSLPRCTCCILPNGTSSSLTRSFHGRESVHGFVGNVVLRNLFDRRTRCVFARSRRLLLRPRMLPVKD